MLKKLILLLLSIASAYAMNSVELNVNDKDLEFGIAFDMGQFNDSVEPDTVFVGGKLLHADREHSDIATTSQMYDYYEFNFLMKRNINDSNLEIGLGVKLNGTNKYMTVPLGAEATYEIPVSTTIPLYIGAAVYYAPEILSMADAKNFIEQRFTFDIEVIENGLVTLGYRSLATNYDYPTDGDIAYNRSVYAGFRFRF